MIYYKLSYKKLLWFTSICSDLHQFVQQKKNDQNGNKYQDKGHKQTKKAGPRRLALAYP